jgi:hypothetical protein
MVFEVAVNVSYGIDDGTIKVDFNTNNFEIGSSRSSLGLAT